MGESVLDRASNVLNMAKDVTNKLKETKKKPDAEQQATKDKKKHKKKAKKTAKTETKKKHKEHKKPETAAPEHKAGAGALLSTKQTPSASKKVEENSPAEPKSQPVKTAQADKKLAEKIIKQEKSIQEAEHRNEHEVTRLAGLLH